MTGPSASPAYRLGLAAYHNDVRQVVQLIQHARVDPNGLLAQWTTPPQPPLLAGANGTHGANGATQGAAGSMRVSVRPNSRTPPTLPPKSMSNAIKKTLAMERTVSASQPEPSSSVPYVVAPLHLAVMQGHVEMVECLLKSGASPFLRDGKHRTPLICALFGSVDTLDITPTNFAQIVHLNPAHERILVLLMEKLHAEKFTNPIGVHDVLNAPQMGPALRGITPLCLAAYLGKTPFVKILLQAGALVDGQDANGASPLMYAVRDNHGDAVQVLLDYNASLVIKDKNGWRPAQYAKPFPEMMRLLEKKAIEKDGFLTLFPSGLLSDLSEKYPHFYSNLTSFLQSYEPTSLTPAPSSESSSPAQSHSSLPAHLFAIFSSIKNHDLGTLKQTLADFHPSQVNEIDPASGLGALHYVLRVRPLLFPETEGIVKMLVAMSANVNLQNQRNGKTPLHYLLRNPLLGHRSDVDVGPEASEEERESVRANYQVIESTALSITQVLLRNGANPNLTDVEGNTPLHVACKSNHIELIKVLVRQGGADAGVKNALGQTPLDVCNAVIKHYLASVIQNLDSDDSQYSVHDDSSSGTWLEDDDDGEEVGSQQDECSRTDGSSLSSQHEQPQEKSTVSQFLDSKIVRSTSQRSIVSHDEHAVKGLNATQTPTYFQLTLPSANPTNFLPHFQPGLKKDATDSAYHSRSNLNDLDLLEATLSDKIRAMIQEDPEVDLDSGTSTASTTQKHAKNAMSDEELLTNVTGLVDEMKAADVDEFAAMHDDAQEAEDLACRSLHDDLQREQALSSHYRVELAASDARVQQLQDKVYALYLRNEYIEAMQQADIAKLTLKLDRRERRHWASQAQMDVLTARCRDMELHLAAKDAAIERLTGALSRSMEVSAELSETVTIQNECIDELERFVEAKGLSTPVDAATCTSDDVGASLIGEANAELQRTLLQADLATLEQEKAAVLSALEANATEKEVLEKRAADDSGNQELIVRLEKVKEREISLGRGLEAIKRDMASHYDRLEDFKPLVDDQKSDARTAGQVDNVEGILTALLTHDGANQSTPSLALLSNPHWLTHESFQLLLSSLNRLFHHRTNLLSLSTLTQNRLQAHIDTLTAEQVESTARLASLRSDMQDVEKKMLRLGLEYQHISDESAQHLVQLREEVGYLRSAANAMVGASGYTTAASSTTTTALTPLHTHHGVPTIPKPVTGNGSGGLLQTAQHLLTRLDQRGKYTPTLLLASTTTTLAPLPIDDVPLKTHRQVLEAGAEAILLITLALGRVKTFFDAMWDVLDGLEEEVGEGRGEGRGEGKGEGIGYGREKMVFEVPRYGVMGRVRQQTEVLVDDDEDEPQRVLRAVAEETGNVSTKHAMSLMTPSGPSSHITHNSNSHTTTTTTTATTTTTVNNTVSREKALQLHLTKLHTLKSQLSALKKQQQQLQLQLQSSTANTANTVTVPSLVHSKFQISAKKKELKAQLKVLALLVQSAELGKDEEQFGYGYGGEGEGEGGVSRDRMDVQEVGKSS